MEGGNALAMMWQTDRCFSRASEGGISKQYAEHQISWPMGNLGGGEDYVITLSKKLSWWKFSSRYMGGGGGVSIQPLFPNAMPEPGRNCDSYSMKLSTRRLRRILRMRRGGHKILITFVSCAQSRGAKFSIGALWGCSIIEAINRWIQKLGMEFVHTHGMFWIHLIGRKNI